MAAALKFSCPACGLQIPWKKEIAGRQGKCKCGNLITVPQEVAAEEPADDPADEGMYDLSDLAADADRAAAELPPTIVNVAAAAPSKLRPAAKAKKPAAGQRGPVVAKRERNDADVFIDRNRDVIAPSVMGIAGAALYLAYYAIHYDISGGAIIGVSVGLSIITAIEAVLLIGFAVAIAGPLGVAFGDFRTAWYKFVAIAVLCDGVTVWVDGFLGKYLGAFGRGFFGFGIIGLPVALGVYWSCLTYLFSMDPGDAWSVVAILSIFYRIARLLLVVVLLKTVLGWGGIAGTAVAIPSNEGPPPRNAMADEVDQAREMGLLEEARAYIKKWGRDAETGTVEGWYSAGAKSVWYEVARDFNGHGTAYRFVIELPADKPSRAKIYDIARQWYGNPKPSEEADKAEGLRDRGEPYLMVALKSTGE